MLRILWLRVLRMRQCCALGSTAVRGARLAVQSNAKGLRATEMRPSRGGPIDC